MRKPVHRGKRTKPKQASFKQPPLAEKNMGGGWSPEMERYATERMCADPQIVMRDLASEANERFGTELTRENFRYHVGITVYKHHPWVREARTKQKIDRKGYVQRTIAAAKKRGRYEAEIQPFLSDKEIRYLDGKCPAPERYRARESLMKKLQRWERGEPLLKKEAEEQKKRLREILQGRDFSTMAAEAGLNKTEKRSVELYILDRKRRTLKEVADEIGVKEISVSAALRRAENRLRGREWDYHLRRKYFGMRDEEITDAIRETGAKTRTELSQRNKALYRIANERGVLDTVFPRRTGKTLARLKQLVKRMSGRKLRKMSAGLTALETGILKKRVMQDRPEGLDYFGKAYGVNSQPQLTAAERRLLAKLRNEPYIGKARDDLKVLVARIGKEKMGKIKQALRHKELQILARRVEARKPETLEVLGAANRVTRERIRQIEEKLLEKLKRAAVSCLEVKPIPEDYNDETVPEEDIASLQRLKKAVESAGPETMMMLCIVLKKREIELLESRAYAEKPESLEQLAEKAGRRSFVRTEKSLTRKIVAAAGSDDAEIFGALEEPDNKKTLERIKETIQSIGPERVERLQYRFRRLEVDILEMRANAEHPARLREIARNWGRKTKSVKATEDKLLKKLLDLKFQLDRKRRRQR